MRQMARWYMNRFNKLTVYDCVAACDCEKGVRLCMGAFTNYQDIEQQWLNNPATTRVYHATAQNPVLSDEQTLTAEERAARKERADKYTSAKRGGGA